MGKSLGNVLEPGPLVAAYGSDAVRLFFTKEVLLGQARGLTLTRTLTLPLSDAAAGVRRLQPRAHLRGYLRSLGGSWPGVNGHCSPGLFIASTAGR